MDIEKNGAKRPRPQQDFVNIVQALCARLAFFIHSVTSIGCLVWIRHGDLFYWVFVSIPALLFLEGYVTIATRGGNEYKRFCPSILIFLLGSVPPMWFVEIHFTAQCVPPETSHCILNKTNPLNPNSFNSTEATQVQVMTSVQQTLLIILVIGRWLLPKGSISRDELSQLLLAYLAISSDIVELFAVFKIIGVRTNMRLTILVLSIWSVSLVQFPLIITTSKGILTTHTGAIENGIDSSGSYPSESENTVYGFAGTLTTHSAAIESGIDSSGSYPSESENTASGAPRRPTPAQPKVASTQAGRIRPNSGVQHLGHPDDPYRRNRKWHRLKRVVSVRIREYSIWGIVTTILLQDGPFLGLRIYILMTVERMNSYSLIFFLLKNCLLIAVQLYRFAVICSAPLPGDAGTVITDNTLSTDPSEPHHAYSTIALPVTPLIEVPQRSYSSVEQTRRRKIDRCATSPMEHLPEVTIERSESPVERRISARSPHADASSQRRRERNAASPVNGGPDEKLGRRRKSGLEERRIAANSAHSDASEGPPQRKDDFLVVSRSPKKGRPASPRAPITVAEE